MGNDLAVIVWRSAENVTIRDTAGRNVALFPLAFSRAGGDDCWKYIFPLLMILVDIPEDSSWAVKDCHGQGMRKDSAPIAGMYIFEVSGEFVTLGLLQRR